tara:strand:+ start:17540 stop:17887 length:348 start_codon:yes stop_codon:yes gene_type:complete
MTKRVWNLEKISENYPLVLIDTCALISHIEDNDVKSNEGFASYLDSRRKSAAFFIDHFNNGAGIYVTSFVLDEFSRKIPPYNYRSEEERDLINDIKSNGRFFSLVVVKNLNVIYY